MADNSLAENIDLILQQVSAQLRLSLGNIPAALQRLAPPQARDESAVLDSDAAILCRSYYQALRLSNNLADIAMLTTPRSVRLQNEDIVSFCHSVIQRAVVPAELLELQVSFQCAKKLQVIAMDADQLERLLLNLLSNAFKFTPRGGKVSLEVAVESQWVKLILRDTGCGISEELAPHVFDLYRYPQRTLLPGQGLGLGLPICRSIAEAHGGSILLTSQPDAGTTVTVALPNRKNCQQELRSLTIDYGGGFNRTLLELADMLPKQAFEQKYLD